MSHRLKNSGTWSTNDRLSFPWHSEGTTLYAHARVNVRRPDCNREFDAASIDGALPGWCHVSGNSSQAAGAERLFNSKRLMIHTTGAGVSRAKWSPTSALWVQSSRRVGNLTCWARKSHWSVAFRSGQGLAAKTGAFIRKFWSILFSCVRPRLVVVCRRSAEAVYPNSRLRPLNHSLAPNSARYCRTDRT